MTKRARIEESESDSEWEYESSDSSSQTSESVSEYSAGSTSDDDDEAMTSDEASESCTLDSSSEDQETLEEDIRACLRGDYHRATRLLDDLVRPATTFGTHGAAVVRVASSGMLKVREMGAAFEHECFWCRSLKTVTYEVINGADQVIGYAGRMCALAYRVVSEARAMEAELYSAVTPCVKPLLGTKRRKHVHEEPSAETVLMFVSRLQHVRRLLAEYTDVCRYQ